MMHIPGQASTDCHRLTTRRCSRQGSISFHPLTQAIIQELKETMASTVAGNRNLVL